MKRPLILLALIPLGLWAIFALPDALASNATFWDWRKTLVILSGLLALWWMSAGMVLATRPTWLAKQFGGLDKLYRLHKTLGIGSGILVFSHWMIEWLPKKLSKLGWIPPRPRGPKGMQDMWLSLAKDVGEWAGYILLALVVIALIRRIPYRYFRLVHKGFGLVFIAGAFHGLMLMPNSFWSQPLAWLSASFAAAGIIAALLSLSNRIGRNHQYSARIETINPHAGQVLEIVCRPQAAWPGHRAGQFLFANFGQPGEGAHPFTIASAWDAKIGTLTLAIKALGDFTAALPEQIQTGQILTIEGPYGEFDFSTQNAVDHAPQESTATRQLCWPSCCAGDLSVPLGCNIFEKTQIWVAGGIGVTPFLAKLNERASNPSAAVDTDFFYCTAQATDFPDQLETLCQKAGVRLHRRVTSREGALDSAQVQACLKPDSSVWFCGPAAWGSALAKDLVSKGLPRSAFHREAFEFR